MASLADPLVTQLLESRHIAALATENPDGSIHMVAVWYWFDGTHVFVTTSSRTRKARNVQSRQKATLMIDSRDAAASCGVTLAGAARILTGDSSAKPRAAIHSKYLSDSALQDPRVGPVFAAFDDVAIQITPTSVISWDMRELDRLAFGGAMERNPNYLLPLRL